MEETITVDGREFVIRRGWDGGLHTLTARRGGWSHWWRGSSLVGESEESDLDYIRHLIKTRWDDDHPNA